MATRKRKPGKDALSLSEARRQLSPLVQQVNEEGGKVAIMVHGEVKAYVVGASRMAALEAQDKGPAYRGRPAKLRGTLTIVGDLDEALAATSGSLEQTALEEWDELTAAPSKRSRRR